MIKSVNNSSSDLIVDERIYMALEGGVDPPYMRDTPQRIVKRILTRIGLAK